jgi:hypothetical protein
VQGTSSGKNRLLLVAGIIAVAAAVAGFTFSRSEAPRSSAEKPGLSGAAPVAAGQGVGADCDTCTKANCNPERDGCEHIADATGRKLCEDAYACFVNSASQCLKKNNQGDAIPCWCGNNMTTCWNSNEPPKQANGPCLKQVFAAAATTDAATIRSRLVDPAYPLGRAVNLSSCRGSFCARECGLP